MIEKTLDKISWLVTEEQYRADPALSYSTIAKYNRSGFNELGHLFDKVESPSLTFGSAVDSLITGGEEEFNNRFMVAEFPSVPDSVVSIIKHLFTEYSAQYMTIKEIPDSIVIVEAGKFNYQNNWKPETRAKVIKEKGSEYYKLMYLAKDKTILDSATYSDVRNSVEVLRNSPTTRRFFADDNPFSNVRHYYQLKFKATLDEVDYRCMADLIIVDYENKVIIPVDLKTSGKHEWDFYKSFIDWDYQIQARLYWRIIRDNLDRDEYFKDFELTDYLFIVVNRKSLTPLVWECPFTKEKGLLKFGKNQQIEMQDPQDIGAELHLYLEENSDVPIGILKDGYNNIKSWLDKL